MLAITFAFLKLPNCLSRIGSLLLGNAPLACRPNYHKQHKIKHQVHLKWEDPTHSMGMIDPPNHPVWDQPSREKTDQSETNGRDEYGSSNRQDETLVFEGFSGMQRLAEFHASQCVTAFFAGQALRRDQSKTIDRAIPP